MPPFLPAPALTLAPLPPPPHAARRHPAPLAAASNPTPRRPYRRRPSPAPAPPQRPQNAAPQASSRARSEEELEAAIYDFMCCSDKPGAFPTRAELLAAGRAELLAAGRADLAAAVESSRGWLSLGWYSDSHAGPASSSGCMHPDYPPEPASSGGGMHPDYPPGAGCSDLAPAAGASGREEASPSERQPGTEEKAEAVSGTGLEGMLTRLQREREQARPPLRSNNRVGGQGDNGGTWDFNSQHSTGT